MIRIVMENAGLSFWPALSLVIFFIMMIAILAWIFRPGSSEFYRKLGRKPLEDGPAKANPGNRSPDDDPSTPKPSPEE